MIISHLNFIDVLSVVAACRNHPHTLLLFDGTNSNHKHIEKNCSGGAWCMACSFISKFHRHILKNRLFPTTVISASEKNRCGLEKTSG